MKHMLMLLSTMLILYESVFADQDSSEIKDENLITSNCVGFACLGMTLEEVKGLYSEAKFERTTKDDGVIYTEMEISEGERVFLYANERNENKIQWRRYVRYIETHSKFHSTSCGVKVGMKIKDVESILGDVTEIRLGEIEAIQTVKFSKSTPGLIFFIDYSGIFEMGTRSTVKYEKNGKIRAIGVSKGQ